MVSRGDSQGRMDGDLDGVSVARLFRMLWRHDEESVMPWPPGLLQPPELGHLNVRSLFGGLADTESRHDPSLAASRRGDQVLPRTGMEKGCPSPHSSTLIIGRGCNSHVLEALAARTAVVVCSPVGDVIGVSLLGCGRERRPCKASITAARRVDKPGVG